MIYGVDGTGPTDSNEYYAAFRHSFVHRICATGSPGPRVYFPGPYNLDYDDRTDLPVQKRYERRYCPRPYTVAAEIRARHNPAHKLYLTGYSRGGAIVIAAATILHDWNIPVDALFLFDAVNRSMRLPDTDFIPPNVRHCYHALRSERANSRGWFGNCGTQAAMAGHPRIHMRHFFTTHGGMGGTPWGTSGLPKEEKKAYIHGTPAEREEIRRHVRIKEITATNVSIEEEAEGMQEVEHWMWDFLRHHHVV
jgi:hypothetical protein